MKLTDEQTKVVHDTIYNFEAEHKAGLTDDEIQAALKAVLKKLNRTMKSFDKDAYSGAMMGNTCMMSKGNIINYHCDVYKGIVCGLEGRDLTVGEWD